MLKVLPQCMLCEADGEGFTEDMLVVGTDEAYRIQRNTGQTLESCSWQLCNRLTCQGSCPTIKINPKGTADGWSLTS